MVASQEGQAREEQRAIRGTPNATDRFVEPTADTIAIRAADGSAICWLPAVKRRAELAEPGAAGLGLAPARPAFRSGRRRGLSDNRRRFATGSIGRRIRLLGRDNRRFRPPFDSPAARCWSIDMRTLH